MPGHARFDMVSGGEGARFIARSRVPTAAPSASADADAGLRAPPAAPNLSAPPPVSLRPPRRPARRRPQPPRPRRAVPQRPAVARRRHRRLDPHPPPRALRGGDDAPCHGRRPLAGLAASADGRAPPPRRPPPLLSPLSPPRLPPFPPPRLGPLKAGVAERVPALAAYPDRLPRLHGVSLGAAAARPPAAPSTPAAASPPAASPS